MCKTITEGKETKNYATAPFDKLRELYLFYSRVPFDILRQAQGAIRGSGISSENGYGRGERP
jgi:hypothetical protein